MSTSSSIQPTSLWKTPKTQTVSLGKSILESFYTLASSLEPSVQQRLLPILSELKKEKDEDFLLHSLFQVGVRLKSEHQEIPAQAILGRLSQADVCPEIRERAKREWEATVGIGSSAMRLEHLLSGLSGEGNNYLRGIAPMVGAGMIGRMVGTSFLGRLAGTVGGFWTRGVGASFASGTAAFLAELPAFVGLNQVFSPAGGGALGENVLSAALGLGVLRGFAFLGNRTFLNVRGLKESKLTRLGQTALSLGGMFGALYGAQKLEAEYGLRSRGENATTGMDVLGSMAILLPGIHLGNRLLGRSWAALRHEMEARTDLFARYGRTKESRGIEYGQAAATSSAHFSKIHPSKGIDRSNVFAMSGKDPNGSGPGSESSGTLRGATETQVRAEAPARGEKNPIPSHINWNRWYGFYNPALVSQNPPMVDLPRLLDAFSQPLSNIRQAEKALEVMAGALPTFRRILDRLELGSLSLGLWEDSIPAYLSKGGSNNVLYLPRGRVVGSYLAAFFNTAGGAVLPPEGVELPPETPKGNEQEIREALMRRYTWGVALAESFSFQIALELSSLGVQFSLGGGESGLLGPTDMALFRIFRERGMGGIAEVYPRFMVPRLKGYLDVFFNRTVGDILAEGSPSSDPTSWTPPEVGEKPELPRTKLDEEAEASARFDRGFYTRSSKLIQLPQNRLVEVQAMLETKIFNERDLLKLRQLIEEIAPELASVILHPWKDGTAKFRVLTEFHSGMPNEPVALMAGPERLLGLKDSQTPEIVVRRGERMKHVIDSIVMHLSRLVMPPEALPPISISRPSHRSEAIRELSEVLERRYSRQDLWGYSGLFELYHQAGQTGVSLPKNEHHFGMERILRECGFDVLCERWHDFTNPDVLSFMRMQFQALAAQMANQLVRPIP